MEEEKDFYEEKDEQKSAIIKFGISILLMIILIIIGIVIM